jgi:hypothetical protein
LRDLNGWADDRPEAAAPIIESSPIAGFGLLLRMATIPVWPGIFDSF